MTATLGGSEWSAACPGRTLPSGKTRYPFYRRLGGSQGRSGRAKNLVPTGIRSRTAQPLAQSLYRLSYRGPPIWYKLYLNYYIFFCNQLIYHESVTLGTTVQNLLGIIFGLFSESEKRLLRSNLKYRLL